MGAGSSSTQRPRQCLICLEEKSKTEYRTTTPRCGGAHTPDVCIACVRHWIRRSLEVRGTRIACPQCPAELDHFAVKELADTATFERYEKMVLNRLLEQDPSFVWCAQGCGSGQSHPAGSGEPIMTCHHCHRQTCVAHKLPWHPGLTCRQFDELLSTERQAGLGPQGQSVPEQTAQALLQRARDDAASRELVGRTSKPCPSCHFDIQKDGGCDMMTCKYLTTIAERLRLARGRIMPCMLQHRVLTSSRSQM